MNFFTFISCSLLLTTTIIESATLSERLHISTLQHSSSFQHKKKLALVDTVIVHLISSASPSSSSSSSSSLNSLPTSSSTTSSLSTSSSLLHSSKLQNNPTISIDIPSLQCIDGITYWDPIKSQCTNCTKSCPTGGYITRQCNREKDTECECLKGSYLSLSDGSCKPCAQCPSGSGVWRTCRGSRNTVCRKCQPGTYSGVSVGTLGCIPCTKCTSNQEVATECDGNRDTVCLDRNSLRSNYSLYFSSEITAAAAAAKAQLDEEEEANEKILADQAHNPEPLFRWHSQDIRSSSHDSSSYVLPVYFTFLVIIVFAGSIYAFFQFRCVAGNETIRTVKVIDDRKFHQTSSIQPILHSSNGGTQHITSTISFIPHLYPAPFDTQTETQPVSYMHLYPTVSPTQWHLPIASRETDNLPKLYQNGQNQYKAYYELLYAPYECEQSLSSTSSSSIASTVRLSLLDELEHKLGNDLVSWKMLARDFGYDDQQISSLECQEENRKNSVQTVSKILQNWATKYCQNNDKQLNRDDIEKLLCDSEKGELLALALVRIGRIDCARLLRSSYQTLVSNQSSLKHERKAQDILI